MKQKLVFLVCVAISLVAADAQTVQYTSKSQKGNYTSWAESWKLPAYGVGTIFFKAKASNDLHIAFSASPRIESRIYELVLGGWANTKTVLRKKSQGPILQEKAIGLPSPGKFDDYWVHIDKVKMTIAAGTGTEPGKNIMIEFTDPQFLDKVRYFAFSSWDSTVVIANVSAPSKPVDTFVSDREKGAYTSWRDSWRLSGSAIETVYFRANAKNDLHVALSPQKKTAETMYELVLGGWANTKSVVRRSSQGEPVAEVKKGLKAPGKDADYWVRIDRTSQTISAGFGTRGGENVLISYSDLDFVAGLEFFALTSWDSKVQVLNVSIEGSPSNPVTNDTAGY